MEDCRTDAAPPRRTETDGKCCARSVAERNRSSETGPARILTGRVTKGEVTMGKTSVELLIFDLDGTLIESKWDIAASVNLTLAELGLPQRPVAVSYTHLTLPTSDVV